MKTLLTNILLIIMPLVIFGQTNDVVITSNPKKILRFSKDGIPIYSDKKIKHIIAESDKDTESGTRSELKKIEKKVIKEWDEQGNPTEIEVYEFDEDNPVLTYKIVDNYNADNSIVLSSYYNWDKNLNKWKGINKEEYTYSDKGDIETTIYSIWNEELEVWEKSRKREHITGGGVSSREAEYFWNNGWVCEAEYIKEWDDNSNLILSTSSRYNTVTGQLEIIKGNKTDFSYDEDSNILQVLHYTWNTQGSNPKWEKTAKINYQYEAGKLKYSETRIWNNNLPTPAWEINKKREIEYDSNGNEILNQSYEWRNGSWLLKTKMEANYNNDNIVTMETEYGFDGDMLIGEEKRELIEYEINGSITKTSYKLYEWHNEQWKLTNKLDEEINDENELTIYQRHIYVWDGSNFMNSSKETIKSKSPFGQIYFESYIWGSQEEGWIGDELRITELKDGKIVSNDTYSWNEYTNDWYKSHRIGYDVDGQITLDIRYYFDDNINEVIGITKNTYESINDGMLQNLTSYEWDYERNDWVNINKHWYTIDDDGYLLKSESCYWNKNNSSWSISYRETYYYDENTTNLVNNVDEIDVNLYPNPVKDNLYIEHTLDNASFSLYNLSGKEVMNINIINNQVSLQNIPSGLYMYMIKSNGNTKSGKLIKK